MENNLLAIAQQFALQGEIESISILGAGFINDTYIIRTKGETPDYILQRKNRFVFPDPPSMMDNIARITAHIKGKIVAQGGNPLRECLTVIPTNDGTFCYQSSDGNYWAVSLFIPDTITINGPVNTELAYQGGMGIGRFQAMLSDFDQPLCDTLPGFHNIRFRFQQWERALEADAAGRVKNLAREIDWIESRKEQIMHFWSKVESGILPKGVAHNDTKLSNMLFDRNGNVLCVIDLDTCMMSTPLNDVGDALRSYTNTGAEDERQLEKVSMDIHIFESYIKGYLSQRYGTLVPEEIKELPFSGIYITFEQVLRFLMDYIDGDKYYKIAYPEHNLARTHAQFALLQSMEKQYGAMQNIIADIVDKQNFLS